MNNYDVKLAKNGFWHLPKAFYAILFIEFWERFAFYGLQSVAVIYFIQKFNLSEANANNLFASFSAMLYSLLVIGGYTGDRILGLRRTYFLGILLLVIGYGILGITSSLDNLYFGFAMILIGNVFFKTNANHYVSKCFEANDPRLDSAFTYFYMTINGGSLFSIVLIPIVAKLFNYNIALSICAFAMLLSLILYYILIKNFKLLDNYVGKTNRYKNSLLILFFILSCLASVIISYIIKDLALSKIIFYIVSIGILLIYLIVAFKLNKHERKGMLIALILLLQAIIFWILYMQTATSITLFAYHNVDLKLFNFDLPAGVIQAFNPFFIIFLSPILANIYITLHKHKFNLTISNKFVYGIFFTGLCFIILAIAGNYFANNNAQISILWIFLAYFFYSLGELLISALGPSMVSQLMPKRFGGFAQGIWYLSSAIGMKIGGQISALAASEYEVVQSKLNNTLNNTYNILDVATHSIVVYVHLFSLMGAFVIIIAFGLLFMLKPINRAILQLTTNN